MRAFARRKRALSHDGTEPAHGRKKEFYMAGIDEYPTS
jgi:hypothetical protein